MLNKELSCQNGKYPSQSAHRKAGTILKRFPVPMAKNRSKVFQRWWLRFLRKTASPERHQNRYGLIY